MPAELDVQADRLHAIHMRVKATGDGELRRELSRGIRSATKPIKDAVKQSALGLPARGGLGRLVSRSRISNAVRVSSRGATVQLKAVNAHDIRSMDRGRLRHPVFGHRAVWVNQQVKPGWWSDPIQQQAPHVRAGIQDALTEIARKIGD